VLSLARDTDCIHCPTGGDGFLSCSLLLFLFFLIIVLVILPR
jgi:hypothetical protein